MADLQKRGIQAVGYPWKGVEDEEAMSNALRVRRGGAGWEFGGREYHDGVVGGWVGVVQVGGWVGGSVGVVQVGGWVGEGVGGSVMCYPSDETPAQKGGEHA